MLAALKQTDDVEDVVYAYLTSRFPALNPCDADTPLLDGGALDSLGFLELMMFLGERFGIDLEDGDFDPANIGTPGRLVAFIRRARR